MFRNLLRNPGLVLTAIWLILTGMRQFITVTVSDPVIGLIALVAGILLLRKYHTVRIRKTLGFVLLGVWLIVVALLDLSNVQFADSENLMRLFGLIVGFFIALINDERKRRRWGLLFLSIWLLLRGVVVIAEFQISSEADILAVFAFITGILIFIDR
ncbi:MAG: hypothetical protein D6737_19100 [Chloroflexi bacterium]|nr:MAG: hypothetical protein CUN54_06810 [Phototrophicales bacterium]RMF76947.1 MAG: hypothetical protein D6737_19100 [Chloroflexota bacterium]